MGKTLMAQSPGSIYASLAALTAARLSVDEEDYGKAKELLAWVSNNTDQLEVKRIARLRLARIHLAENDAAQAWMLLADMDKGGELATVQELKGDVLAAQNKLDEARKYYEIALARLGTADGGGDTQTLQAKLNDLGPATPAEPTVK
jgi:predicted negative regulator of RcsB-dependent stress response